MHQMRLRERWSTADGAFGGWCAIPSSFSAEIVGSLGFDYVCVDLQHGLADFHDLLPMLQALSTHGPTPLVRIPLGDFGTAQRALDAGAEGLIFPMISSAEDAAAAARACRYPPRGDRSYGPIRSRMHLGPDAGHANEQVACIVMIETRGAIDNLDAILTTEGIDAIYVGPSDLAFALGVEMGDTTVDATIGRILESARRHGIPAGIHTNSGAAARKQVEAGFSFATVFTDAGVLTNAYRAELEDARGGHRDSAARPDSDADPTE